MMLIESTLQDVTQVICDIYSRYLFETEVVEKRKDGFLFSDDLEDIMLRAQKKAYGTGLITTSCIRICGSARVTITTPA